jgi:hypothetical protein
MTSHSERFVLLYDKYNYKVQVHITRGGEKMNTCWDLVRKLKENNRPLGKPRSSREKNIITDVRQYRVAWIGLMWMSTGASGGVLYILKRCVRFEVSTAVTVKNAVY